MNKIKRYLEAWISHLTLDYGMLQRNEIYRAMIDYLAFADKQKGVDENCETDVIISLTTFGDRINTVYKTIESLMMQTMKPKKIVLWVADNELVMNGGGGKSIMLNCFEKRGLEILTCEDIRSYKKLIPTLNRYPDSVVITVDDDVIYPVTLVEELVKTHKLFPDCVVFNYGKEIVLSKGLPDNYSKWKYVKKHTEPSHQYIGVGVGGILYPPNCFISDVVSREKFEKLAPYADDIWFKMMALLNGTKYIENQFRHIGSPKDFLKRYITIEDEQTEKLATVNVLNYGNDKQLNNVLSEYGIELNNYW